MSGQRDFPWEPTSASGVGSYPGEDPEEAVRTIVGELPQLPHLPELPARGVGADITGRTAGILVEFPVEVRPTGWRVAARPGRDLWRSRSLLTRDLDALEEHTQGYTGPLKIQLAGPWTLAATIELRGGDRLVADPGAVGDLCESYVEGLGGHILAVAKRVPGARLLVQVDEPALPAVLRGALPTASGYSRLPAVDRVLVEERLRSVFATVAGTGAFPMAHCCDARVPVDLLRRCGARALSLDATLLDREHDEPIGAAVEGGAGLFLGVVPGRDAVLSDPGTTVDPVRDMWHRIGFAPDALTATVVVTPACGLAGASPDYARRALAACRDAARVLREEPRR